jgi:BMFP domain-containing protein YqiC
MTAKVQFKSDAPEYRFDFTFPALSRKPAPPPDAPGTSSRTSPVGRIRAPTVSAVPVAAPATAAPTATAAAGELTAGADPSQIPGPIPETVNEMLAQLKTRNEQVGDLVQRGAFGALWVPAFQARDLAIALEAHLEELSAARRDAAEPAIQLLVRTAWLLDAFGDIGNRQQIVEANAIFASAVNDVVSAFTKNP